MIRQVIVGVDFSPESRRALWRGTECAQRLQVPLKVIHVLPSPLPAGGEIPLPPDPARMESEEREAKARLAGWLEGIPGAEGEVVRGACEAKLLAASDPETLLVVARHDHATMRHLLYGSTSLHLARHAQCPVMLIPAEAKA